MFSGKMEYKLFCFMEIIFVIQNIITNIEV